MASNFFAVSCINLYRCRDFCYLLVLDQSCS